LRRQFVRTVLDERRSPRRDSAFVFGAHQFPSRGPGRRATLHDAETQDECGHLAAVSQAKGRRRFRCISFRADGYARKERASVAPTSGDSSAWMLSVRSIPLQWRAIEFAGILRCASVQSPAGCVGHELLDRFAGGIQNEMAQFQITDSNSRRSASARESPYETRTIGTRAASAWNRRRESKLASTSLTRPQARRTERATG